MADRPEPVFIAAGNLSMAASTAMDLGLPFSANSPFWRFLDDANLLRGRRTVRICFGYRWVEHRAAYEIEKIVRTMETRLPGSVEIVEVPDVRP